MLLLLYLYEYAMASTTSVANSSQKVLNIRIRSCSNNNENTKRMRRMYIVIIKLQNCPFCAFACHRTFFTHITILYYSHIFMPCPFACLFHYTYSIFSQQQMHALTFCFRVATEISSTQLVAFFFLFLFCLCRCRKNKS